MGDESEDRDQGENHPDHRDQVPLPRDQEDPIRAGRPDEWDRTPLITLRTESSMFGRLPRVDPHCVYVLAYGGNELREFRHTPRFGDRAGSVGCYVVDTSRRSMRGTLRIPARGDRYFFDASYDAEWRVADPVKVVRDNLDDGHGTVARFLRGKLGSIGRRFDPDDAAGVEREISTVLDTAINDLPVGGGLALIGFSVQLTPDPKVTGRGIALDDDVHEGTLIERRAIRLGHLLEGDGSAIIYHLAQNPTDTHAVLQMIVDAKDKNEQLRLEWLDRMRADGAILEADYEHARETVLGSGHASPYELGTGSPKTRRNQPPPIIEAGPSTAPPPERADNPFKSTKSASEPTTSTPNPPPPPDSNPFAAPPRSGWPPDQEPEAPSPGRHRTPPPTAPPDRRSGPPRAPRDVRADRLDSGSVFVQWRDAGDVEYQVRRRLDDGRWQVVAHTKDTFIEDNEAPPGALSVYAVSAMAGGLRSSEAHSGS